MSRTCSRSTKSVGADKSPRPSSLAPDLKLGISCTPTEGRWILTFELHGYDPKLEIDHRVFKPVQLEEDPRSFLIKIFQHLEDLPKDGGLSPGDILHEFNDFSPFLYRKVLPPGPGPLLEEHQGQSLQIHSHTSSPSEPRHLSEAMGIWGPSQHHLSQEPRADSEALRHRALQLVRHHKFD